MLLLFRLNVHRFFHLKTIKKVLNVLILLKKKIDKSNRKPNKIWVDKGRKFNNRLMNS